LAPDGNQTAIEEPSGDITTNTWSCDNRLTQVEHPSGAITTYAFNGDGLRYSKDDGVDVTVSVYDGNNVLQEYDDIGVQECQYTYIPQQYAESISQIRDSVSSFFLFDGLQNVCQLTDDSETVTDEYAYSADGQPISTTGTTANSQTYKGQRLAYHRGAPRGRPSPLVPRDPPSGRVNSTGRNVSGFHPPAGRVGLSGPGRVPLSSFSVNVVATHPTPSRRTIATSTPRLAAPQDALSTIYPIIDFFGVAADTVVAISESDLSTEDLERGTLLILLVGGTALLGIRQRQKPDAPKGIGTDDMIPDGLSFDIANPKYRRLKNGDNILEYTLEAGEITVDWVSGKNASSMMKSILDADGTGVTRISGYVTDKLGRASNAALQRLGNQMAARMGGGWKATIETIRNRRYLVFTK
jgi:YD repeat-containing protein